MNGVALEVCDDETQTAPNKIAYSSGAATPEGGGNMLSPAKRVSQLASYRTAQLGAVQCCEAWLRSGLIPNGLYARTIVDIDD
ncbi:MAG: hypothetical protein DHS20C16_02410 [Phycisphaerae bacterium]|nr:MAG: hypothetical protein DHS20C16_02410 [Phycisphaerae bacterium]